MPSVTNCQNLHSNMFLLFPDEENKGKKTKNTFTFQYVSIISAHGADDRTVTYIFTFQYVSIISMIASARTADGTEIYIPICFYYFFLIKRAGKALYVFTFQYVSIISLRYLLPRITNGLIYIPICFYYFNGTLRTARVHILIYIPICFYYFDKEAKKIYNSSKIYIPICFYYFQSEHRKDSSCATFTFQYVSIISRIRI